MHARDTDPVEIALASGILLLGLPQDARLARLGGRDPQAVIARVREARAALHDPLALGQLRRLAARAHVQIPTGLDDTDALIDAVCVAVARRTIIGVFLQRAPLGPPIAAPVQKPAPAAVPAFARMSAAQRIGLLLERTPKALAPDLAREFQSMTSPEARAAIVAGLAVLLVAQCAGVGEVVDAALAWWAYKQAGLTGLAGLYEALRAVVSAVRAESEGAFDQAVTRFAEGLTLVGVALLTVVVTRAASKRAGGGESGSGEGASYFSRPKPEPAPQRWPIAPASAKTVEAETGVAAETAIARAARLGREGEAAVRGEYDIGPKVSIDVNGRVRIPDGLTDTTLSEVKNVSYQSFTRQLQDYFDFCQQTDRGFDLYLRPNTEVSSELQQAIDSGLVNRLDIPQ